MASVSVKVNSQSYQTATQQANSTHASNSVTKLRIEQIARMRIAGVRDQRIAELLGINVPVLRYICSKQDYQELEEELLLGHVTKMDEALAGKTEELRQGMRVAVPVALRCIVDAATQRRDLRTALAASEKILELDPDRTFTASGSPGDNAISIPPSSVLIETSKHADLVASQIGDNRNDNSAKPSASGDSGTDRSKGS